MKLKYKDAEFYVDDETAVVLAYLSLPVFFLLTVIVVTIVTN